MRAEIMRQAAGTALFVVSDRATTANTTAVATAANITIRTLPYAAHERASWTSSQGAFDPLISGTRIPIYRIAALLSGGMSVKEVAEDFPSLNEEQILGAQAYAMENPPSPAIRYPQQSIKRLLRGSGFVDPTDAS